MPNKVVVVGSYNTDLTIKTSRIPQPGETIVGGNFSMNAGGKGANQVVAAARAGAQAWFVGRVGDDELGHEAIKRLQIEGVNCDFVIRDSNAPTGTAFIIVDEHGENCIVVASGANMRLSPGDIEAAHSVIATADVLVLQLESPLETVEAAAELAAAHGVRVILNPAPARSLEQTLLRQLALITPNALEAEMLAGIELVDEKSMLAAAENLMAKGVAAVLFTLGSRGIFLADHKQQGHLPAFRVHAVDTTAAGDIFSGALSAFLQPSRSLQQAAALASAAAALSVTKIGALNSAPHLHEIETFIKQNHHPVFSRSSQVQGGTTCIT